MRYPIFINSFLHVRINQFFNLIKYPLNFLNIGHVMMDIPDHDRQFFIFSDEGLFK